MVDTSLQEGSREEEIRGESTPLLTSTSSDSLDHNEAELKLLKARRLLYVSHLFNQFSENAWQFCLVLFLAAFSNYESLFLVSSYGLVSGLGVCYFGSVAGRFVDSSNRLFAARVFIGLENLSILFATLFCYFLLANQSNAPPNVETEDSTSRLKGIPSDPLSVFLLIGIHILGSTARILDSGFLVAIERDWVVVMSQILRSPDSVSGVVQKRQKEWLSETNVYLKQIDLSCQIVAPAFAGFLVAFIDDGTGSQHGSDLRGAALFVGILNASALVVEYACTARIYHSIPGLAVATSTTKPSTTVDVEDSIIPEDSEIIGKSEELGCWRRKKLPAGLDAYFEQPVSFAGISLSLLYLNALTFGGIMTAYLVWRGMTLESIGVWRGVSSAVGLSGTVVFQFMNKRMPLTDTGLYSVSFQFLCLTLCYVSLFVEDNDKSLAMLIGGVCASRVGLWVFDISITTLMQEHIPEGVRGLVGGVQESLNAFFFFLSFALGLFIPDPKYFHIYVLAGYCSVGLAVVSYLYGYCTKKKLLETVS